MVVLRLEAVSKNFEGLEALKNVSFDIKEGDIWGIIGPNGSGKTTLLNIISDVLPPTSGKVYLFERDVTNRPLHAFAHLGLARTFQLNTLFLSLTILDNVLLAIEGIKTKPLVSTLFRSLSRHKSFFREAEGILLPWGLWDKRELLVKDLSYGEQRCLELILGLVSNPKVILLDEPTAGLSAQEIAVFKNAIQDLLPDITVIIVEHNMSVIFDLTKYIIVLDHGEIIAQGAKERIRTDHRVREVYLGTNR